MNDEHTVAAVSSSALKWRSPRSSALVWLALAALVIAIALGPAPPLVPTGIAAVLMVGYVLIYGPWSWKRSHGWRTATRPIRRIVAWYGYGEGRAELVLRPRVWVRVVLWPLLPWTMYCRVELRNHTLTSFGHPLQHSPMRVDRSTSVTLLRDQKFALPSRNVFRVLGLSHPLGGRIRLTVAVWSHWRQLAQIVDPDNRLGLEMLDWPTNSP